MENEQFYLLLGETICFCQDIEQDLKLIYAGMSEGNMYNHLDDIEKMTLGQIVTELEKLDNSDEKPYFSNSDYKLLKTITEERNYLIHKIYRDFIYERGQRYLINYEKAFNRLLNFHNRLAKLRPNIQKVTSDLMKMYGRI